MTLDQQTQVWSALGQPYRLSACYEVRMVLIDSATERPTTRVSQPVFDISPNVGTEGRAAGPRRRASMSAYRNSREHLFDELRRLDLVLNLAVARQRRDPTLVGFNEFRGLFISEDEIDRLLAGADGRAAEPAPQDDAEGEKIDDPVG